MPRLLVDLCSLCWGATVLSPHLILSMLLYRNPVHLVSFTVNAAGTVFRCVFLCTQECVSKVISDQINAVGLRLDLINTFISLE